MKVIDMFEWHQRMQRSIYRTGTRVEIEDAVAVHRVHRVLDLRLRTFPGVIQIERLHGADFVEV